MKAFISIVFLFAVQFTFAQQAPIVDSAILYQRWQGFRDSLVGHTQENVDRALYAYAIDSILASWCFPYFRQHSEEHLVKVLFKSTAKDIQVSQLGGVNWILFGGTPGIGRAGWEIFIFDDNMKQINRLHVFGHQSVMGTVELVQRSRDRIDILYKKTDGWDYIDVYSYCRSDNIISKSALNIHIGLYYEILEETIIKRSFVMITKQKIKISTYSYGSLLESPIEFTKVPTLKVRKQDLHGIEVYKWNSATKTYELKCIKRGRKVRNTK